MVFKTNITCEILVPTLTCGVEAPNSYVFIVCVTSRKHILTVKEAGFTPSTAKIVHKNTSSSIWKIAKRKPQTIWIVSVLVDKQFKLSIE